MIVEEDDEFLFSQNYDHDQIFDQQRIVNFQNKLNWEIIKDSHIYKMQSQKFKTEFEQYIYSPIGIYTQNLTQKIFENSPVPQYTEFQQNNLNESQTIQMSITSNIDWDESNNLNTQKILSQLSNQVQGKLYIMYDNDEDCSPFKFQYAAKVFEQKKAYLREKETYLKIQQIIDQKDKQQINNIIALSHFEDESQTLYHSMGIMNLLKFAESKTISKQSFTENEIWYIMVKLTNIVTFLHKNNIYHSDIKPANIQLFQSEKKYFSIKLCDFGSCTFNNELISFSPPYIPSNHHSQNNKEKYLIDMFAIGRICYQLMLKIVRLTPYFSTRESENMEKIINEKLKDKFSEDLIKAVSQLLFQQEFTFLSEERIKDIQGLQDQKGEIITLLQNQRQKKYQKYMEDQQGNVTFQKIYAEINISKHFTLLQSAQDSLIFMNDEKILEFQDMVGQQEFLFLILNLVTLKYLSQEFQECQKILDQYVKENIVQIDDIEKQAYLQNQFAKIQVNIYLKNQEFDKAQQFLEEQRIKLESIKDMEVLYIQGQGDYFQIQGDIQLKLQKIEESIESLKQSIELKQKFNNMDQNPEKYLHPNMNQIKVSYIQEKLALIYQQQEKYQNTIELLQQGLQIRQNNVTDHNSLVLVFNSIENILKIYKQKNDDDKKIEEYLEKYNDLKNQIDQSNKSTQNLAEHYHNLALNSAQEEEQEEAMEYINKALDILDGLGESNSYEAIQYLQTLGTFQRQLAEYDAAQHTYKKAQVLIDINFPEKKESAEYGNILNHIATCHLVYEEHDEAEEYFKKAVEISENIGEKDQENLALYYYNLALVYKYQVKYEECIEASMKALEINQKIQKKSFLSLRKNAFTIGTCYMKLQQKEEGKKYLLLSLDYLTQDDRDEDEKQDEYLNLYNELGYLFFSIQQPDECITYMEKAKQYHEKAIEEEPEDSYKVHLRENFVNSLRLLAFAYKQKQQLEKFVEFYIQAINISKLCIREKFEELEFISDYNQIAMTFVEANEFENAEKYYDIAFKETQLLEEIFEKDSIEKKDLNFMKSTLYRGFSRLYEKWEKWDKFEEIETKNIQFKEENHSNEQDEQLIVDYINLGVHYQQKKQDNEKAEELFKKGYALAETLEDLKKTKIALLKLNQLFMGRDSEKYVFYALKYIEYLNKNQSNIEEIPGIYVNLGNAMYKDQSYDLSVEFLDQAIKEIEKQETEKENCKLVITVYEIMNLCYEKLKENMKSIETQMKILEIYEKYNLPNDEILANMTYNLAYTYNELQKYDFTYEYLKKAAELAEECLPEENKFSQLYQIATIFAQRNKFQDSLDNLNKCVQILDKLGQENKCYQENYDDLISFKKNIQTIASTIGGETGFDGETNDNDKLVQQVEDFDI